MDNFLNFYMLTSACFAVSFLQTSIKDWRPYQPTIPRHCFRASLHSGQRCGAKSNASEFDSFFEFFVLAEFQFPVDLLYNPRKMSCGFPSVVSWASSFNYIIHIHSFIHSFIRHFVHKIIKWPQNVDVIGIRPIVLIKKLWLIISIKVLAWWRNMNNSAIPWVLKEISLSCDIRSNDPLLAV